VLLNLGGDGVRDLGHWHGQYLIVAGPAGTQGVSRVYLWKGGRQAPELLPGLDLRDFNPEAVIVYPHNRDSFQLLSDDGTLSMNGVACKHVADVMQRRFRGLWVTPAKSQ
jgi:hypothetical protein